jgi:hypothetical protein
MAHRQFMTITVELHFAADAPLLKKHYSKVLFVIFDGTLVTLHRTLNGPLRTFIELCVISYCLL